MVIEHWFGPIGKKWALKWWKAHFVTPVILKHWNQNHLWWIIRCLQVSFHSKFTYLEFWNVRNFIGKYFHSAIIFLQIWLNLNLWSRLVNNYYSKLLPDFQTWKLNIHKLINKLQNSDLRTLRLIRNNNSFNNFENVSILKNVWKIIS